MSKLAEAIDAEIATLESIRTLESAVQQAVDLIGASLRAGGKLLVCGNGGSAADSAHFSSEFVGRFKADRRPYPVICLPAEAAAMTGISNDYSYDEAFARQVRAFGRPEDVLVVFTSSGNSENLILALRAAGAIGMQSVAFLGRDGGRTRGLAGVDLIVAGAATARIQEAQKLLLHVVCEMLEDVLPRE